MLKDFKASRMFTMLRNGCAVAEIARRLTVSEKTIRTYRDRDLLPSQIERAPRTHRTRIDPLEAFWPEIEALLESDPRLKPITLLGWLQQKHNVPGCDPSDQVAPDTLRRTLERRVHKWKLEHDVEQEVVFPQIHQPGDVMAIDFVDFTTVSKDIASTCVSLRRMVTSNRPMATSRPPSIKPCVCVAIATSKLSLHTTSSCRAWLQCAMTNVNLSYAKK